MNNRKKSTKRNDDKFKKIYTRELCIVVLVFV